MISEICRKVQERVAELEKEEASAEPAACRLKITGRHF